MEFGTQIKKYRNEYKLSQEELAERVFVSRQSISNWENGKTYPDIKSLLLLSEVFSVSFDKLIKGDIEIMKKFDIQTYKEIVAFMNGDSLDEIEKAKENGKRPYQKFLLTLGSALLGVVVAGIIVWLFR